MIRVRPAEARDVPGLGALFADRFGHPLSLEEWTWKYRALPGEARSWIATDPSGRVLAHGGALCLPARLGDSGGDRIWQLTDWAGSVSGGGLRPPLVELGRRLLEDLPRPKDAPWIFGFPSDRHFRLGRRVFGYRPLPGITPSAGPIPRGGPGRREPSSPRAVIEVADHCGDWPEAAEAAWTACDVLGIRRSADFLNWRYHARPGRYYRFYRLRRDGGPDGLAVFAFMGREARAAELWLPAAPEGAAAWEPALRAVAADLAAAGLERWTFWPPPCAETADLLDRLGLVPEPEPVVMGCRGPAEPDPRFHYSMGDYDLI